MGPTGGRLVARGFAHRTDRESNVFRDPFRRSNRTTFFVDPALRRALIGARAPCRHRAAVRSHLGRGCRPRGVRVGRARRFRRGSRRRRRRPCGLGGRRCGAGCGGHGRPSCCRRASRRPPRGAFAAAGRPPGRAHDARRNVVEPALLAARDVFGFLRSSLQRHRALLGLLPRRLWRLRLARSACCDRPPHAAGLPRRDRLGRPAPDGGRSGADPGQLGDARPDRNRPGAVVPRDRVDGTRLTRPQPSVPSRDDVLCLPAHGRDGAADGRVHHARAVRVRRVRLDGHLAAVPAACAVVFLRCLP